MKKKIVLAVLILLALVAGGVYYWQSRGPAGDGPLVLYGNVDIREVELAFRQGGRLASLAVDEGHAVRAGDLLAEIDAQPFSDALAVAEAQVAQAEAELAKLRRGNRPQEIRRAEAAVQQAEAAVAQTAANLERQEGLAQTGAASQRVLEAARAAHSEATASLASVRQALSLQREGARVEDIAAAQARLAAAEASREQARTALADTRLVAPSDGIVSSRLHEAGSIVGNHDPIYTLSLSDPVYVRAYVGETDLGRIAPGTQVQVSTDSSDQVFSGQVGFISPKAEFTPKAVETTEQRTALVYRLRIVVDPGSSALRQGMPVTVRVDAPPSRNAKP